MYAEQWALFYIYWPYPAPLSCPWLLAKGEEGDTMREAVHTEKHAPGDALLPPQLVDGWLSYAGRASVSAARWHDSQGA